MNRAVPLGQTMYTFCPCDRLHVQLVNVALFISTTAEVEFVVAYTPPPTPLIAWHSLNVAPLTENVALPLSSTETAPPFASEVALRQEVNCVLLLMVSVEVLLSAPEMAAAQPSAVRLAKLQLETVTDVDPFRSRTDFESGRAFDDCTLMDVSVTLPFSAEKSAQFAPVLVVNAIDRNVAEVPVSLNRAVALSEEREENFFVGADEVLLASTVIDDVKVLSDVSAACVLLSALMVVILPRWLSAVLMRRQGSVCHPHVAVSIPCS